MLDTCAQTPSRTALVVDDDPLVLRVLTALLHHLGWQVTTALSAEEAFQLSDEQSWTIVFCDVHLGRASGFEVLERFQEKRPESQIVLMTGSGSASDALEATAMGAFDYILKPFKAEAVAAVSEAVLRRFERLPADELNAPTSVARASNVALIGSSPALVEVMKRVGRIAPTDLPVLVTGESGTGKEVLVRVIHQHSNRRDQPFVAVNCGAIPAELIESELFGHTRGSFTGADRDRPGLFEEADGGTVFLDEITETSPQFQVKLLRVLQEGEIRRVGSNRSVPVNVRVVAASNRDPKAEVGAGRFRQDLYYRLSTVRLHLPPLRERRDDIVPLAAYFIGRLHRDSSRALRISREAIRALEQYSWPGNIRELENAVMHAAAMCDQVVRRDDLPDDIHHSEPAVLANGEDWAIDPPSFKPGVPAPPVLTVNDWVSLESLEAEYLTRVLTHTSGNKLAASRILNVDRKTVDRMILKQEKDQLGPLDSLAIN